MIGVLLALAMQTSTTDCTVYGYTIHCRHTPGFEERMRALDEELREFREQQDRRRATEDADRAKAAEIASDILRKEAERKEVLGLSREWFRGVREGDCAKAETAMKLIASHNPAYVNQEMLSSTRDCWANSGKPDAR